MTELFPAQIARKHAMHICNVLGEFVDRIEIAGSLRRSVPEVHDIDLVAVEKWPTDLFGHLDTSQSSRMREFLAQKVKITAMGNRLIRFSYAGIPVDLYTPPFNNFGTIMFIRTGSREWNTWVINAVARPLAILFREGEVYKKRTLQTIQHETDLFELLEMPWIPPNERHEQLWMPRWRNHKELSGDSALTHETGVR
jgi:DNA polymerase/3'-5' exonuclease PolX